MSGQERWSGSQLSESVRWLTEGIFLDGRELKPAGVEWLNEAQLRVTLREGKHRQVRAMRRHARHQAKNNAAPSRQSEAHALPCRPLDATPRLSFSGKASHVVAALWESTCDRCLSTSPTATGGDIAAARGWIPTRPG